MQVDDPTIELIRILLARLERVAVDSHWAHRASGIRGGLIRSLDEMEAGESIDIHQVREQIHAGFRILERSAREKIGFDVDGGQ